MNHIEQSYALARERYAEFGVDTDRALELLRKTPVSAHCWQLDDLTGAIKMALTVWFVSAIDLLYGFFSLRNVLPQSILDQRIQADLLRHCANRGLLVQLR